MDTCTRKPGCKAPANSGHWCPAQAEQVRQLGYRQQTGAWATADAIELRQPIEPMSPFVRRALARELPAKVTR